MHARACRDVLRHRLPPSRTLFTRSNVITKGTPVRTTLYVTLSLVGFGVFAVYYSDSRAAVHRYFLTPLLHHALEPELGHKVAVQALRSRIAPVDKETDDERLRVEIWDQSLSNPIGLAAGFDKNGEAVEGLFGFGFSWVEIGSVTPYPQPGNPPPRVFHLDEDSALINRYGFPSQGHAAVLSRLRARQDSVRPAGTLFAVNLGKNKSSPPDSVADFIKGIEVFGRHADALVVNVSSPNTPGLRGLQNRGMLEELLVEITRARDSLPTTNKPRLLLKIAPDLSEAEVVDIAEAVASSSIDGVIVSNTTTQRPQTLQSENRSETGGLSGPPLKPLSLATIRTLRTHLPTDIPLIGCGGISNGADALEFARAGASFVQLYTAFGYGGAGTARRIKDELSALLAQEGTTWSQIVQNAVKTLSAEKPQKQEPQNDVQTLVREAEGLKDMLDKLAESMKESVTST